VIVIAIAAAYCNFLMFLVFVENALNRAACMLFTVNCELIMSCVYAEITTRYAIFFAKNHYSTPPLLARRP
jgi:hypothetical protein